MRKPEIYTALELTQNIKDEQSRFLAIKKGIRKAHKLGLKNIVKLLLDNDYADCWSNISYYEFLKKYGIYRKGVI